MPMYFPFTGPGTVLDGPEPTDGPVRPRHHQGIGGEPAVKAAIPKCATDEPGADARVRRVTARGRPGALATSVPITTHTHAGAAGPRAAAHLRRGGVDLSRVVISGCSGASTWTISRS